MAHRDDLITAIAEAADLSQPEATAVFDLYRRNKAIRFNAHDGFTLTHGAFLDRAVILKALQQ